MEGEYKKTPKRPEVRIPPPRGQIKLIPASFFWQALDRTGKENVDGQVVSVGRFTTQHNTVFTLAPYARGHPIYMEHDQ
ncbi:hypothetical protein K2173_020495 [Erythroxylum novogranatense]|uniref:Uncharacterized protein n=1 Tax=Erythroxylum novogranatense TaxID=1862640 RepID=A0AAV8TIL0_9ROSI|nr:hypothetical protein K2173_020495 [Erythroxylum novogranatense]